MTKPTTSLLAIHAAESLMQPDEFYPASVTRFALDASGVHPVNLTFRRCMIGCSFSGGAILEARGRQSWAHCGFAWGRVTYRLKAGWDKQTLARAVHRAMLTVRENDRLADLREGLYVRLERLPQGQREALETAHPARCNLYGEMSEADVAFWNDRAAEIEAAGVTLSKPAP
jgi:hypothetical protein